MRSAGMVTSVEDLGRSDHGCWSYDRLAEHHDGQPTVLLRLSHVRAS